MTMLEFYLIGVVLSIILVGIEMVYTGTRLNIAKVILALLSWFLCVLALGFFIGAELKKRGVK